MSAAANRYDIPVGRRNAISKEALASLWNCSEREARHAIAELRAKPSSDGYAILSSASGPVGYWRSNRPEELEAFIRETYARGRNVFLAVRDAKRLLEEITSRQVTFSDFGEV